ncbi:Na+/proline symporter [Neorhodopirellula lusitana]|uniref:Na+/proline symporter n=1 Tax=Neorhodopirellula lusitana TaxID=445327 RepID=A0ABY1PUG1_9BACT|nr:sodium:solute symporter family protein [Neorhodopirellula lusitana]SMP43940.1 Na+/proline symporter [Neorhodopirellula lusitana]
MELNWIDQAFIVGFFLLALAIGLYAARQAGENSASFFLSGRHMPWWLLGMSMVATTFSTDTPNLVTDIVRKNGVAGNWVWWAFLLTGMLTVFLYAKLWRRSGVLTDIEFYELRYSGKTAAFLRGFRALYLGVFFNIMIMATVSLAAIKIGGIMLGLQPWESIVYASAVTVCFSTLGGLTGVLLTDFFLFFIALIGAAAAAYFAVQHPDIGSLSTLFSHPNVVDKLSLLPQLQYAADGSVTSDSMNLLISVLIMPIAVQWWSVWYPGAEPGGGGYLAQRMLAAKNERHATGAVLFFNAAHYALRPWPWILVALCSMIVFPDLESLQREFPGVDASIINDDLAYPAMLKEVLPHGWLGLVLASLAAAYMSTISTHLNWGSSYVVNDFYKRFVKPDASEKQLVFVGRVSTVMMMVLAGLLALQLSNALQAFQILLQIGAGTGLIFILRWFWWRINAISELVAMAVSFVVAISFQLGQFGLESWQELLIGVAVTTVAWVATTFVTQPTDVEVLKSFCLKINPGGPGWRPVYDRLAAENLVPADEPVHLPTAILCMVLGTAAVYGTLFASGLWMYGQTTNAVILTCVAVVSTGILIRLWTRKNGI